MTLHQLRIFESVARHLNVAILLDLTPYFFTRSVPDRAARSNSERAAPSACVGKSPRMYAFPAVWQCAITGLAVTSKAARQINCIARHVMSCPKMNGNMKNRARHVGVPFLLDCPIRLLRWALSFAVTHQIRSVTAQSQFAAPCRPASGCPSHCQCGPR